MLPSTPRSTDSDWSRRRALALAGSALASLGGLAGCTGRDAPGTATPDATGTDAGTSTPTTTPTGTGTPAAPSRLVVEWLDEPPADPVPVHPPAYREFLREAATTEGAVRTTVPTLVYDPEPVLPTLDAVELVAGDGDSEASPTGVYAVEGEGDTYYRTSVVAEPVADGGNASDANVTDVDALPAERAAFVRRTVREGVEVEPQTERGTWARESFLGERFRANGTVYRGVERKPTDAEFFATEVWYALELVRDDAAEPGARLDLRPPDGAVADALSELDRTRLSEGAAEREVDPVPDPIVAFARGVGAIGTPTGFYSVSVE